MTIGERVAERTGTVFGVTRAEIDAWRLYEYAKTKPKGFTYQDACAKFGYDRQTFYNVVRVLRLALQEDSITLPCEPQGYCQPYLYRLSGTMDDVGPWERQRMADMESRLETMVAVARPVAKRSSDPTERRKARKIERTLTYLQEELAEIT